MINKVYSILLQGTGIRSSGRYSKYCDPINVSSTYLPMCKVLIPKWSPDAMSFRASALLYIAGLYGPLWDILVKSDLNNTYSSFPSYAPTQIQCACSNVPCVCKEPDCAEPVITGTIHNNSSHVIVSTTTRGVFTVPFSQGMANVTIPRAYTLSIPSSLTGVVDFTITGTPVQPVINTKELMPFMSLLDPDIYEKVDTSDKYSITTALCCQLARSVNG